MQTEEFNIREHVANLPDPTKDPMPQLVGELTEKELVEIKKQKASKVVLLRPKNDTEKKAKYVVEKLFNASLRKDGDWQTIAGGSQVWQRKITDYVGELHRDLDWAIPLYMEVKGVSPGNPFAFSRLTSSVRGKKSQWQKLQEKHDDGCLVFLTIGWWDRIGLAQPIEISSGKRTFKKWRKSDVELTLSVIPWGFFSNYVVHELKGKKSIGQKDRYLLKSTDIFKRNNRWVLENNHWWDSYSWYLNDVQQQV